MCYGMNESRGMCLDVQIIQRRDDKSRDQVCFCLYTLDGSIGPLQQQREVYSKYLFLQ